MPSSKARAAFIPPMLLLRTERLPEGSDWLYELKLDGYRAIAFKTHGKVHLRSRNDNDFNGRYPAIVEALSGIPDESVIDGEIVAFNEAGKPSFNALQNYGAASGPLYYYVFDAMMIGGKDISGEPLKVRRELLDRRILCKLSEPVRESPVLNASLKDLLQSVKAQGLEGLVAKRGDSRYEAGQRSGIWLKMRVNQGQEFVIGGYTPTVKNFDALIFGYYEDGRLMYAARTRNGFTPSSREQLFREFNRLHTSDCPFDNLPESKSGRWGVGLTAAKMQECRWLKPMLVGQFEFLEWTPDNHLRHTRFIGLREDKKPREVIREG